MRESGFYINTTTRRKVFKNWWTAVELVDFLRKQGIKRTRKTILQDIKESFSFKRLSGHIVISRAMARNYVHFVGSKKRLSTREINIMIEKISLEEKKRLENSKKNNGDKDENGVWGIIFPRSNDPFLKIKEQGFVKAAQRF